MLDARSRPLFAIPRFLSVCRLTVCAAGVVLAASAQAQNPSGQPAGMVTGAWGQSQQMHKTAYLAPNSAEKSSGTSLTAATNTVATSPTAVALPSLSSLPSLPALGAATDPVSKFLQERGLLAQAQGESSRLMEQMRDAASGLVVSAMNFLGVRYTRGGNSVESGFDCSGFTRHIFEMSVGMVLPHRADEQARMSNLLTVKREELKPGDLVFFNTMKRTFSHVGIYVGEGKFIHSPRVGGAVRVEDMREAYWAKRFTGARRADLNASVDSPKAQR
ncbi:C40 family peptidase [Paucibacter sp. AS339]|uniref:C40 family peptidase n=1 Tax=Paucibacter hankyongi TaxID=3133434 RepID=UPI00309C20EF